MSDKISILLNDEEMGIDIDINDNEINSFIELDDDLDFCDVSPLHNHMVKKEYFDIPGNIDLTLLQNTFSKKDYQKALWFISRLSRLHAYFNNKDWIQISANHIRYFTGSRSNKVIVNKLVELGYIEIMISKNKQSYFVGKSSKSYKLVNPTKGIKVDCNDMILNNNIKKWKYSRTVKAELLSNATDTDKWLYTNLKDVKINYQETNDIIETYKEWLKYIKGIDGINNINDESYIYIIDDYGRRHTNITSLSKKYRKLISFKSDHNIKLIELDISCSQVIFFISKMLKDMESDFTQHRWMSNTSSPIPYTHLCCVKLESDVLRFRERVSLGMIYDDIKGYCNYMDRDSVKKDFFAYILYGYPTPSNDTRDIVKYFKTEYPTVWNYIQSKKAYPYSDERWKDLARDMQRIESKTMFNEILPKIIAKYPTTKVLTIHDSIICPISVSRSVAEIMQREIEKLGIDVHIKMKEL